MTPAGLYIGACKGLVVCKGLVLDCSGMVMNGEYHDSDSQIANDHHGSPR